MVTVPPLRTVRPFDLGLAPSAGGLQDARTEQGGQAQTLSRLVRDQGSTAAVAQAVGDPGSAFEDSTSATITLPASAVTLSGFAGLTIPGPERVAAFYAVWSGFGDATWGGIYIGALEVTRGVRLTGGAGAFAFPWLVGGQRLAFNPLPTIQMGVEDASLSGTVSLIVWAQAA